MVREANANVFSPAARMFPVLAVAVLVGAGQSSLMIHQASQLDETLAALTMSGRNVVTVAPPSPDSVSTVDRVSCEALAEYPQIERAGLVGTAERTEVVELGAFLPLQPVSATLLPGLDAYDAVVGSALWSDDDPTLTLAAPGGQVLHAEVGDEMPAGVPTGSALAIPLGATTTSGSYCVVVLDPYLPLTDARTLVLADLQMAGEPLAATSPYKETVDVVALHLSRTERFLPAGIAVLAGFSVLGLSRLRSSELAAYRLSGTSRRSLATILLLEQAILAGFYLTSATAAALVLGPLLRDPAVPILWAVVGALGWTVCAGSAASITVLRRASDLAKDR